MKLVSSNDRQATQATIQQALALYRPSQDAAAALDGLTTLKGIGPATASLLLAVHDPDSVVFFADEAFYWLCGGGAKAPVRYTAREYEGLQGRCRALGARLGVRAVDVEKVAFVLMRDSAGRLGGSGTGTAAKTEGPMQKKDGQPDEKQQAYKRKKVRDEEQIVAGDAPRRSKRGKKDG